MKAYHIIDHAARRGLRETRDPKRVHRALLDTWAEGGWNAAVNEIIRNVAEVRLGMRRAHWNVRKEIRMAPGNVREEVQAIRRIGQRRVDQKQ